MTNLFLASVGEIATVIAAFVIVFGGIIGGIILIIYFALTNASKEEVERLQKGESPFTGRGLTVSTVKSNKGTRNKFSHYRYGDVTITKTGENTARVSQSRERVETQEWTDGAEVERWKDFDTKFTLLVTQTRRYEKRKNPDSERMEQVEVVIETLRYEVENYGNLGARNRCKLRSACRKAGFVNKRDF